MFAALGLIVAGAFSGVLVWHLQHPRVIVLGDSRPAYVLECAFIAGALAASALAVRRPGRPVRLIAWMTLCGAFCIAIVPYAVYAVRTWSWHRRANVERIDQVRRLRLLAVAEEDYRIRYGTYSSDARNLGFAASPDELLSLTTDGRTAWSATLAKNDGSMACTIDPVAHVTTGGVGSGHDEAICRPGAGSSRSLAFARVGVMQAGIPAAPTPPTRARLDASNIRASWPQYRGDAERFGGCCEHDSAVSWHARIATEIRSSPIIAGDELIVGGHGTGELVALDRRTGALTWRTRAPNWIHNDPVALGHIIVVAFGNNELSERYGVLGSPPSGVAAYDLASGRQLWAYYVDGAVMSSAAIAGRVVMFASADRHAYGLDLESGALRWRSREIDPVYMANPALRDSTLYVTGEPNSLCALSVSSGRRTWCQRLSSHLAYAGLASPAVADSTIVMTAVEDSTLFQLLRRGGVRDAMKELWLVVAHGTRTLRLGHQLALGVSRANGDVRWTADLGFGNRFGGHVAGSPSIHGGVAYIVSPVGRTTTAVRMSDGVVLWQRHTPGPIRGSPSIIGSDIVSIDSQGNLEVIAASTGALVCSTRLPLDPDRAGVTIAGATAYLAGGEGQLAAVPIDDLVRCNTQTMLAGPAVYDETIVRRTGIASR